jgi:hypothetical protein
MPVICATQASRKTCAPKTAVAFNAVLLAITATHKKPIEKCNIVALTVAILGAVMFFHPTELSWGRTLIF